MKPIVHKINPKAIIPTKRQADAGFDLVALFDKPVVLHQPHEMMIFKTGLKIRFDSDYVALVRERGSTRLHNLNVGAGVIEGNYSGEYLVMMTNLNAYIDIIYIDGLIFWEELKYVLHKAYPNYGWLTEFQSDYKFEKDEMGRLCMIDVREKMNGEPTNEVIAYVYPQSKAIAQMVITKKEDWVFEEVDEETFNSVETDRGEGKFGSSGA